MYLQFKTEQAAQGLQAIVFCLVNVDSNIAFKHFEDLKDLILKKKIGYVLPPELFLS